MGRIQIHHLDDRLKSQFPEEAGQLQALAAEIAANPVVTPVSSLCYDSLQKHGTEPHPLIAMNHGELMHLQDATRDKGVRTLHGPDESGKIVFCSFGDQKKAVICQ